jgi:hypothetical protein
MVLMRVTPWRGWSAFVNAVRCTASREATLQAHMQEAPPARDKDEEKQTGN